MAHELSRLKERILKKPQLITASHFESILDYIDLRNETGLIDSEFKPEMKREGDSGLSYLSSFNKEKRLGTIVLDGALSYRPVTFMGMDCGGASYQAIKNDFERMVQLGATTVAFNIDSPGGEAYQCFQSAKYIRQLADDNDIKLIGYVDGMAASAAYAFASVMHELVMAEGASVGSIGVVIKLTDLSEAKAKAGIKDIYIHAGADKVPFAKDGSFKEAFLEELESDVKELYEEFVTHVAEFRGIDTEAIRKTEARTYTHKSALEMKLVDSVMNPEEFYAYLNQTVTSSGASKNSPFKLNSTTEDSPVMDEELLELKSQLEASAQEKEAVLAQLAEKSTELTSMQETITQLQSQLEELQTAKAQAASDARKAKLASVLPADRVDEQHAALASLSDEAFESVVAAFALSTTEKEKSEMFTEQGSEGVKQALDVEVDLTEKLIEEKYSKGNK